MKQRIGAIGASLAVLAVVGLSSAFVVNQNEQVLLLRFGEPQDVIARPGLHFKIPFADNAVYTDRRMLWLGDESREIIAQDAKRLVVDSFVGFQINDPLKFYQAVNNEERARQRLDSILDSNLRSVLGKASSTAIIREDRGALMAQIRDQVNREATDLGIEVLDVRIRRADLPDANNQAIYRRMQTERQREAAEFRAQGNEEAQKIRARADKTAQVTRAEGGRQSEIIRGGGDQERSRIFAESFEKDPEFYRFYRAMQAYGVGLNADDTTMVLSPDSDFFSYFYNRNSKIGSNLRNSQR